MPRKHKFKRYNPKDPDVREYQKTSEWQDYESFIRSEIADGQSHSEIVETLQGLGKPLKLGQLKRLLRLWGISKKNTNKKQRSYIQEIYKTVGKDGQSKLQFKFKDGKLVRRSQIERIVKLSSEGLEDDCSYDSAGIIVNFQSGSNEPRINSDINSNERSNVSVDVGSGSRDISYDSKPDSHRIGKFESAWRNSQKFFVGLAPTVESKSVHLRPSEENEGEDPFSLENFEIFFRWLGINDKYPLSSQNDTAPQYTDGPDVWSEYPPYREKFEQWIALGQNIARSVLGLTPKQLTRLNEACFRKRDFTELWNLPADWLKFMNWKTGLLPSEILETFLQKPEPMSHFLSPEDARDSQEMRKIFQRNFPAMVKIGVSHKGNDNWEYDFYSQAIHLLEIEQLYGPRHYYLIQAIFKVATILERASPPNDEDIIALVKLLLKKLYQLNLHSSLTRDIPHALSHLARALIRVGDDETAMIDTGRLYTYYCSKIHKGAAEIGLARENISKGVILVKNNKYEECLSYFRQAYHILESQSPNVDCFFNTHGHQNTGADFLVIGKNLKKAGDYKLAVSSFEKSIDHYQRAAAHYEVGGRLYDGVLELGTSFAILGQHKLAILWLQRDVLYRVQTYGLHNAGTSIKALVDVVEARGPVVYLQPALEKYLYVCKEKGKTDGPVYHELLRRVNYTPWLDVLNI
ncbi:hypothetical protein TWF694_011118 [Orbilia ellipsospora]|uniref:Clr5 domain-containing protein n=1 Tax=Orbilia ellipsospora TaxID=2528407 RepID=A0AAV9X825_9PEZI